MVMSLLRKIFGRKPPPPRPPCRLTETEALKIARDALDEATPFLGDTLRVKDVVRTERGVEWRISTVVIGSGANISIDDATGAVIELRKFSGR